MLLLIIGIYGNTVGKSCLRSITSDTESGGVGSKLNRGNDIVALAEENRQGADKRIAGSSSIDCLKICRRKMAFQLLVVEITAFLSQGYDHILRSGHEKAGRLLLDRLRPTDLDLHLIFIWH